MPGWKGLGNWEHVPPRSVQVARDCHQDRHRTDGVVAARRVLKTVAVIDTRWLGRGVESRHPLDLLDRQAGDARCPLRRVLLDVRFEQVKAMRPPGDKIYVVEVLVDHDVDHRQSQGGVGAGADRNPHVGQRHVGLHRGFDGDDLGTARLCVQNRFQVARGGSGKSRLFAPNHDQVAVRQIRRRRGAQGVTEGECLLHGTDAAVSIVGAAVSDQKAEQVVTIRSAGWR
jgi:hypothetical protein